jgi:hypothetical protein
METLLRDLKAAVSGQTVDLHPAVTVAELVRLLERWQNAQQESNRDGGD